MKDYEKMLSEAMTKISKKVSKETRLEIPSPQIMVQGNQTIITNFVEISNILRRDPKHLSKFLFRELATPGNVNDTRLILQGKVYRNLIEKKINDYIKEFVECDECKKLDTVIIKEKRITFLKCEACGAKETVRNI